MRAATARRGVAAAALLCAAVACSGCAPVAPWERGLLAQPQMAIDPLPMRSLLRAHVQGSRESGPAAGRAEGGGCGCSY